MSKRNESPRFLLFKMFAALFTGKGLDKITSNKRAYHEAMAGGGNPEYSPMEHPIMNYAQQNRLAKKRRKVRAKMPK